jgi:hypothetical protein
MHDRGWSYHCASMGCLTNHCYDRYTNHLVMQVRASHNLGWQPNSIVNHSYLVHTSHYDNSMNQTGREHSGVPVSQITPDDTINSSFHRVRFDTLSQL